MSTLFKTFDNDLTARRIHDVRREPVGSFAGILGPDATVGSSDDVPHLRGQGTGAFAGDADRQRQGSFGDVDFRPHAAPPDVEQRGRTVEERE